jgi:FtsZ-binding cell division protein ZapB
MLKKANILFLVAIVILFSISSIRCGSVTKNDTEISRDSQKVSWQVFYNNAQVAIKKREFQIEELRKEILTNRKKEEQKRITTLDSLEQKKNSLKTRLAHFNTKLKATLGSINESDKVLKTTFENAFVKDMNELLAGLRDFWKTSK